MFDEYFRKYKPAGIERLSRKRLKAGESRLMALTGEEKTAGRSAAKRPAKALRIIAVCAAAAVGLTVTAGAAGLIDPLGAFRSFFIKRAVTANDLSENEAAENLSASLDFGAAEITEYNKTIDLKEYTVTVKGFMSDLHCIYVYYDITYKDEAFFENGRLKDRFTEETPISINSKDLNKHTIDYGDGIGTHEDGKTVSYVGSFEGDFSGNVNAVTGNCEFKMTITCFNDDPFTQENYIAGPFETEVSVPTAGERYAECSLAIELPDGKVSTLEGVLISPLSASLYFDNDYFFGSGAISWARFDQISFIMKNGRKVDFNGNSAVMEHKPTPEMIADALENGEKGSYPIVVNPDGSYCITEPDDTGIPIIYKTTFAAVIDPNEVAGIEIMGRSAMFE